MPSRSQLPDNLRRKKFIRALEALGFEVSTKGGKGSHCKITWTKNQKSITIPSDLKKDVLYYLLKEIKKISNIDWTDIQRKM